MKITFPTILNKRIKQIFALMAVIAILFFCQGGGVSTILMNTSSGDMSNHQGCCVNPLMNSIGMDQSYDVVLPVVLTLLSVLLATYILFVVIFNNDKHLSYFKSYLRSMRDRYGGFITLNKFLLLFSKGILHSKVWQNV